MRLTLCFTFLVGILFFHFTSQGSAFTMNRKIINPYVPQFLEDDRVLSFSSDTVNDINGLDMKSGPEGTSQLPTFILRFLQLFNLQRIVRDLETSISFISCPVCIFGVGVFQNYIAMGRTKDEIAALITEGCIKLNIETQRVCEGVVKLFKDEALYVFENVALDPEEVCGIIIGGDCGSSHHPRNDWNVTLPPIPKPPVQPIPLPKPGLPVLRVLQISDTHFDLHYKESANAECGEPLCCREVDSSIDPSRTSGKWGDYRNCDVPMWTVEHMFEYISKNFHIDYILWTGDIPPHDIWTQTRENQLNMLNITSQLFIKHFPNTPVFPAIGNHESSPVNSFPPPNINKNYTMSWLYDELNSTWAHWLPSYAMENIHKGAYYSVLVCEGLRIISLNLNYCNNKNWWLLLNTTDPTGQLKWLISELQYAESNGEKVHIIGHIPPGSEDCIKVWSDNYYKIIDRYESTILAQFYGHTHFDEFELFFDEKNIKRATNIAYISPSATSFVGLNPSFRIYSIDGNYRNSSYAVLDFETYMMDLADANKYGEPEWIKLYSAKSAYNLPSLQPNEWNKLADQMQIDDNLFARYYKYYHRASRVFPPCDDKCRWKLLCNMKTGRSNDPSLCKNIRKSQRKGKEWMYPSEENIV